MFLYFIIVCFLTHKCYYSSHMIWLYSLVSVVLVSLLALIGAPFMLFKEAWLKRTLFILISLSVGALFGDAFIHLIPEIYQSGQSSVLLSTYILLGIIMFFVLEKFINWHHHHEEENADSLNHEPTEKCAENCQAEAFGYTILIGDTLHNFIDGIIIASSYLISFEVGLATTIAVVIHEIPHEVGDLAVMLHAGFSRGKALFFNFLSALASVLGAILALLLSGQIESIVPILLALATGGFIYVAGSDLVPQLHRHPKVGDSLIQLFSILVGIGLMYSLLLLE